MSREFNIPFGPDRTGEFEPVDANFEAAPFSESAPAPEVAPMPVREPVSEQPLSQESYVADSLTEEVAEEQAIDDVQMSFLALKDSIGQGRELKAREKEREELQKRLDADREELADRENILANYHALVAEQDNILGQASQQRDARKAELAEVVAHAEEASEALERMRDYHDSQLDPLEMALGRARATADQAKNDERSRKSELNAAETELRRAGDGNDTTMAAARRDQVQLAYDEAVTRSEAAKEALEQAQRAYDEARDAAEQAEAPLERAIEDLNKQTEELKESVTRLSDTMSDARKRRQYCDSVYQYPDETAKLRASVQATEGEAQQMDAETSALRERLALSREKSKKAKIALIIAGVVVLALIIAIIVFAVGGA